MKLGENLSEILLVEDNFNDEELEIRALKKYGLDKKLMILRDGAEADEYIFSKSNENIISNLKLIILDLKLPKVDGFELLQKIKSNEKTKLIPVVILTSSYQDRDIVRSYQLGTNSYLVKPVDYDSFIKSVSEIGYYWILLNKPPIFI